MPATGHSQALLTIVTGSIVGAGLLGWVAKWAATAAWPAPG